MIATVISTIKWITLGVIVFGEKVKIWAILSMTPPGAYTWSQQNKIVSCMGVFFLSNAIENALIQTGAFEVELNGMPIWSKLKTGRVPQGSELFEIIENQMQLSTPGVQNKFPGEFDKVVLPVDVKTNEEEENDDEKDESERKDVKPKSNYEDEFSEIDKETEHDDL